MIKRRRVGVGEAKIENLDINRLRETHVGRIPSNLPAKFKQIFETLGGMNRKFLNFWVKIKKPLKLQELKINFSHIFLF